MMVLGVEEYAGSGEKMRFFLKDVKVDIGSRDRTYGMSCHSRCTSPSLDVQPECDKDALYSSTVPQLLFSLL
jgi:hypothetical protein